MPELNLGQLLPPSPDRTDLVTFTIKVNGNALPRTVAVRSIVVTSVANRIPFAVVTILDGEVAARAFPASDLDLLSPGQRVEILAGYHGQETSIFQGLIIRHAVRIPEQGHAYLEIECKHQAVKLTAGRHNRYFFNQTDDAMISEIVQGRVPADIDGTSVQHREMVQYHASDWDFIVCRAEANGMLVLTDGDKLVVKKPDFNQQPAFPLQFGSSILEFEAEMDARDQYPAAEATTWNPADQARQSARPGGPGPAAAPGRGALAGAAGLSPSGTPPNTNYTTVLGLDHLALQHAAALTVEEAEAWSAAQMTKSRLASSRGRVKFMGSSGIKPGGMLSLQGVGQRHSGPVFVTGLVHEIGDGFWHTHAQFGLPQRWFAEEFTDVHAAPAGNLLPAVRGLQIGVVTRLENSPSDAEFRVQVRLPLVDGQGDGFWSRLAAQDAGSDRGAVWRPEIGDEVVVGFLNDDPRQAIVLGMLHSSANAAPLPASDQNHEKGWVTRGALRFIFNDDKKSVVLETPNGKRLTIDEQANEIRIEDEHGNKLTMDQQGIVLESASDLTLKAAQNLNIEAMKITQTAQTSFKASSGGQSEVSATGEMVVKGTFVRIN